MKPKVFLIACSSMLLSCCSGNVIKQNERELQKFISDSVIIPFELAESDVFGKETKSTEPIKYWLIYYIESVSCTACEISKLAEHEILSQSDSTFQYISFVYIFDVDKHLKDDVHSMLCRYRIKSPAYIDTEKIFKKNNPSFPRSALLHTFLIDSHGHVILAGDPFLNKNIMNLMKERLKNSGSELL